MKTTSEIIQGLTTCYSDGPCSECPYNSNKGFYSTKCIKDLKYDALMIIYEQKRYIEYLETHKEEKHKAHWWRRIKPVGGGEDEQ